MRRTADEPAIDRTTPGKLQAALTGIDDAGYTFKAGGLVGLLPKRRGPKHGHKLTPEVLLHIEQRRRERPTCGPEICYQNCRARLASPLTAEASSGCSGAKKLQNR
jgi:hypothetical protein